MLNVLKQNLTVKEYSNSKYTMTSEYLTFATCHHFILFFSFVFIETKFI